MKVGIMQPYVFPYIGYYQLVSAVDTFVFLDDVNYINRGWVNRNNILVNGKASLFTIPLQNASQNRKINEITVAEGNWYGKLSKTLEMAYKKAPHYNAVLPLIDATFNSGEQFIGEIAKRSIFQVCNYLELSTVIVPSSAIYENESLKGEDRIIDISLKAKGSDYINPIGGTELYHNKKFEEKNIHLHFIKTKKVLYPQLKNEFVPNLSMIDVLMWCSKEQVRFLLTEYELI